MAAPNAVVNLDEKFAKFSDHWSPKILGQVNDHQIKAGKMQGEFVWHQHDDTDELFFVVRGSVRIRLDDRDDVEVRAGEFFVVPRGLRHCPVAEKECELLLLEKVGSVNTGDAGGALTATEPWI